MSDLGGLSVIFDLDGTLVDSEPNYYEATRQTLAAHGRDRRRHRHAVRQRHGRGPQHGHVPHPGRARHPRPPLARPLPLLRRPRLRRRLRWLRRVVKGVERRPGLVHLRRDVGFDARGRPGTRPRRRPAQDLGRARSPGIPRGLSGEPMVVFGGLDSGVANPAKPDGGSLLDEVWAGAPFHDERALLARVRAVVAAWVAGGLLAGPTGTGSWPQRERRRTRADIGWTGSYGRWYPRCHPEGSVRPAVRSAGRAMSVMAA